MKLGVLKSIGHNIADSLASGVGLMVGVYQMDVFAEAAASEPGFITIDFLAATVSGSPVSTSLLRAIGLYRAAIPEFCQKHGVDPSLIKTLSARFGTDPVYGPHSLSRHFQHDLALTRFMVLTSRSRSRASMVANRSTNT